MHVSALLYDYNMSMNSSVYASCVAQFVIFMYALCVFLIFLGSVPVILFLLLASNAVLILLYNIIHPEYDIMGHMVS